jgi:hypothetical protein
MYLSTNTIATRDSKVGRKRLDVQSLTSSSDESLRRMSEEEDQMRLGDDKHVALRRLYAIETHLHPPDAQRHVGFASGGYCDF